MKKLLFLAAIAAIPFICTGAESDSHELKIFSPSESNGKALVVCPGGGYDHHSFEWEGTRVGEWLSDNGYTVAVLRYRLPKGQNEVPSTDSRAAIAFLREHADSLGINPHKVGIMGFSAGGHLAATTATLSDSIARPDFQVLVYPVITMEAGVTHAGSRRNLLGEDATQELVDRYSLENQVTPSTPKAIIFLSADDTAVPPENSMRYFKSLITNKVPAEMHVYPVGGHGWGMRDKVYFWQQWRTELLNWLSRL